MKQTFPGYYRPTAEDFSQMWDDCVFTLDANVLLDLYRYTPDTREELLRILEHLADRLWISYQAAFEYHENHLEVIAKQKRVYDDIRKEMEENQKKIEQAFRSLRHPLIADEIVDNVIHSFTEVFEKVNSQIDQLEQEHPDLLSEDEIAGRVAELFDGRVGQECSSNQLEQIYQQGEERYKHSIPPGYSDRKKDDEKKFGDLVIWNQIIAFAKETQKPIILVTNDYKEDWWLKSQGETIGPRPELVNEMAKEAGVKFYMYRADRFMEHARERLELDVATESINEVRIVGEQEATQRWERSQWSNVSVNKALEAMSSLAFDRVLAEQPAVEKALEVMTSPALERMLSEQSAVQKALEIMSSPALERMLSEQSAVQKALEVMTSPALERMLSEQSAVQKALEAMSNPAFERMLSEQSAVEKALEIMSSPAFERMLAEQSAVEKALKIVESLTIGKTLEYIEGTTSLTERDQDSGLPEADLNDDDNEQQT